MLFSSVMLFFRRYMLRYLRAVQMMKAIIEENNLTVMATIARYACAYEAIAKSDWWDKSKRFDSCSATRRPPTYPPLSAGPVVEQGTHFCDLSRYFGGDVDIATVAAHSLEWYEDAGKLSAQRIDESKIAPENRIPRITSATWYGRPGYSSLTKYSCRICRKYDSGAVGTFTHCVALQGHDYSCELEVYADGYVMK